MDDMDAEAEELGGTRSSVADAYACVGWAHLVSPSLGGFEVLALYNEAIQSMRENPGVPELFRDIFKNAYLPYRDPETLMSFLKEINGFTYDNSERLRDAFEYLFSVLGSQGGAGSSAPRVTPSTSWLLGLQGRDGPGCCERGGCDNVQRPA